VVGSGTHHGIDWRVLAAVSGGQVCWELREGNGEREDPGCIPRPVDRLAWSEGPWRAGRGAPQEKLVFGIASQDAARVRLMLKSGASLNFTAPSLPPIDAQVISGGRVVPANFFLAFLPRKTSVALAESFTAAGASICRVLGDDFKTPKLPMGCTHEPIPSG
jgi:hypothetical protein